MKVKHHAAVCTPCNKFTNYLEEFYAGNTGEGEEIGKMKLIILLSNTRKRRLRHLVSGKYFYTYHSIDFSFMKLHKTEHEHYPLFTNTDRILKTK